MALIPKYHVAAAIQAVDTSSLLIKMGKFVTLYGTGVRRMLAADAGKAYGVAGDTAGGTSYKPTMAYMPGVASGWQNRVSDGYDEAKASGKVTVYHSGGEFATDQFVTTSLTAVGIYLCAIGSDGATGGSLGIDGGGTAVTAATVAMLTRIPGSYPSGVPGTDINGGEFGGDMALSGDPVSSSGATNQYIEYKLLI